MNLVLSIPQKMKIENTSEIALMFKPYRENFDVSVPAGTKFEFTSTTVGQCLYYFKQAMTLSGTNVGLVVDKLDDFDVDAIVIPSPATITLSNTTNRSIGFIPYREHFEYVIKPGDSVTLETKTLGQCLYYMAQSTKGLEVSDPVEDTTH